MLRFFDKIEKTDTCWNFKGASRGNGYGAFKLSGKVVDAHRVSYMLHHGDIPDGLQVCHSCDNRKCVNPDHLFLGTGKDNMQDCKNKGRIAINNLDKIKHPSRAAYERRGCRCDECKKIKKESQREWRAKKKSHSDVV